MDDHYLVCCRGYCYDHCTRIQCAAHVLQPSMPHNGCALHICGLLVSDRAIDDMRRPLFSPGNIQDCFINFRNNTFRLDFGSIFQIYVHQQGRWK